MVGTLFLRGINMMTAQSTLIKQYMDFFDHPTLKEVSKNTGIQVTRVFRIFNGAEMKISEFDAFQREINKKRGASFELQNLAIDCESKISGDDLKEIEDFLKGKLKVWTLMNSQSKIVD